MQPLARQGYSEGDILALITGTQVDTAFGVDLLTPSLAFIEDISEDVDSNSGRVERNMLANAHGSCDLVISRELAWGRDRVRPWMTLSSSLLGVTGVRFNLGVYLLSEPESSLGETPQSWPVSGLDQLSLMGSIGDSHSVLVGANVLSAVRSALTLGGWVAPILLDSSGAAKVLQATMTWPLTSSDSPTWLRVANELLAAIGYRGLWVDWDGAARGTPYVLPQDRPSELRLDVGSLTRGIVAPHRKVAHPLWSAPNEWVGVANNWPTPPVNGNGRYETDNQSVGLSSKDSLERTVPAPPRFLDATTQADLVTQLDRIKASDMRSTEVISVTTGPNPAMWHADRFEYADAALGGDRQTVARSWVLPLTGADASLELETV